MKLSIQRTINHVAADEVTAIPPHKARPVEQRGGGVEERKENLVSYDYDLLRREGGYVQEAAVCVKCKTFAIGEPVLLSIRLENPHAMLPERAAFLQFLLDHRDETEHDARWVEVPLPPEKREESIAALHKLIKELLGP